MLNHFDHYKTKTVLCLFYKGKNMARLITDGWFPIPRLSPLNHWQSSLMVHCVFCWCMPLLSRNFTDIFYRLSSAFVSYMEVCWYNFRFIFYVGDIIYDSVEFLKLKMISKKWCVLSSLWRLLYHRIFLPVLHNWCNKGHNMYMAWFI